MRKEIKRTYLAKPLSRVTARILRAFYLFPSHKHSPTQNTRLPEQAFTLIELMAVIAIVGILSGIAMSAYQNYIEEAREIKAIAEITIIQEEILGYQTEHDALPLTLADIDRDGLLDPWGSPYQYFNHNTGTGNGMFRKKNNIHPLNQDNFDLYSMGPDGRSVSPCTGALSRDDIVRVHEGRLIGRVSEIMDLF
jgi:general secretion pathway protein G